MLVDTNRTVEPRAALLIIAAIVGFATLVGVIASSGDGDSFTGSDPLTDDR